MSSKGPKIIDVEKEKALLISTQSLPLPLKPKRKPRPKKSTTTTTTTPAAPPPPPPPAAINRNIHPTVVDLLTGNNYIPLDPTEPGARRYACPFPTVSSICTIAGSDNDDEEEEVILHKHTNGKAKCDFRFKRIYDVARHLKASHHLVVDVDKLTEWIELKEEEAEEEAVANLLSLRR
jgi:hypothetical protein